MLGPNQQDAIDSNPENPKMIENKVKEKTTSIVDFLRGSINPPNKMTDINNSMHPRGSVSRVILLDNFLIFFEYAARWVDPSCPEGRLKKVNWSFTTVLALR